MKNNKVLNHFNMKHEKTKPFGQLEKKFMSGKNLEYFEDQYKTTVKRFDRFRGDSVSNYMDEMYLYWPRDDAAMTIAIRDAKQGARITDNRFTKLASKLFFKNSTGNSNGFTSINSAIVHTRLRDGAKKINASLAKKIKKKCSRYS